MVVSHLIHISGFGKLPEPPFFHCLGRRATLVPRSVAAGICARPEDEKTSRAGGLRSSPEGFSGRGIRPVCCVLRRMGRACGSVWGTFGRVLKNVRLSAAAARRLRCRRCRLRCCLRCRRCRCRSSHRRLPHRCALAFVAVGSRLRRSRPDMKKSRRPRRGLRDTFSGLRRIRTCRLRRY